MMKRTSVASCCAVAAILFVGCGPAREERQVSSTQSLACSGLSVNVRGERFDNLFEASASTTVRFAGKRICVPRELYEASHAAFVIVEEGKSVTGKVESRVPTKNLKIKDYNAFAHSIPTSASFIKIENNTEYELPPGNYRIAIRYRPGRCSHREEDCFCVAVSTPFELVERSRFAVERQAGSQQD